MLSAKPPICWICGGPATSGEHKIKHSDLRDLLDKPSQAKPIYYTEERGKSIPVGSFNADRLKFPKSLCIPCNTQRTKPFDLAWEKLSGALRQIRPKIKPGNIVDLRKVFGRGVDREMLKVHLYFAKLFGCQVEWQGISLDVGGFASAILASAAHPRMFLTFCVDNRFENEVIASMTKVAMKIEEPRGRCVVATWCYIVGRLSVQVTFAERGHTPAALIGAWHPSYGRRKIRLRPLFDD